MDARSVADRGIFSLSMTEITGVVPTIQRLTYSSCRHRIRSGMFCKTIACLPKECHVSVAKGKVTMVSGNHLLAGLPCGYMDRRRTHLLPALLSRMTVDHASLVRRSTAPTPNRDTSNVSALITFTPYIIEKHFACLIPVYDRYLLPNIAIISSLLSSVSNDFMPPLYTSPLARHVPPCMSSTLPCFATATILCTFFLLHSTTGMPLFSFQQVPVLFPKSQCQGFRVVYWAEQVYFHSYALS